MNSEIQYPSFKEAFLFWLKLGFISFGGPAGQISIMHNFLVEKKRWISESRFLHALNYCMLLPGPEAQQLAIYTGWLLHGVRGGIAAGVLFVLPSMFILLALSIAYVTFGHLPLISAAFVGLKAAVVAIIFQALLKIAGKALKNISHYIVGLIAFLAIFIFQISFPIVIVFAIATGFLFTLKGDHKSGSTENVLQPERGYLISNATNTSHAKTFESGWTRKSLVLTLCWFIPFLFFICLTSDSAFWIKLIWFFTRAALVTFGGAYAVLPYVARISVEEYHWLSQLQMLDGLALGETTPGPLIMVLSFVGFMAGYHQYGNSITMGALGLVITTWYTFLPCFFFILLGAPFIERTRNIKFFSSVLGYVTAAVTGAILSLGLYFALAVVVQNHDYRNPHLFSLTWILLSFILLMRFKTGILSLIGLSTISGIIYFLITN